MKRRKFTMEVFTNFIQAIENQEQRNRMQEILTWIQDTFPTLSGVIKWNQPMFTEHGTFIIGFSISKHHISFTPEEYGVTVFIEDIEKSGYEHTKGIVKIKWNDEIDYDLIRRVIQFNLEDKKDCKTFFRN